MTEQTPGRTNAGRRRLIQAAAIGAPVVLTLKSNAGWAASVTCDAKTTVSGKTRTNLKLSSGETNATINDPTTYNGKLISQLNSDQQKRLVDLYSANPGRTDLYHSCFASLGIK